MLTLAQLAEPRFESETSCLLVLETTRREIYAVWKQMNHLEKAV